MVHFLIDIIDIIESNINRYSCFKHCLGHSDLQIDLLSICPDFLKYHDAHSVRCEFKLKARAYIHIARIR